MPNWIAKDEMSRALISLGLYNASNKYDYCVGTIRRNKDSLPVIVSIIRSKILLTDTLEAKYWKELLDKLTKYTILL